MSDKNSALFALVDAAVSLPPIPTNNISTKSSLSSSPSRETVVVSEDELSETSFSSYIGASPSPCKSPDQVVPTTSPSFVPVPRKKSASLPLILMDLLSDPSEWDVLSFLPDGLSFAVHSPHSFVTKHMRRLFHCVKFPTFAKKLEKWGFRQVNSTRSTIPVFAHPLFRRGDWESCRRIRYGKKIPLKLSEKSRMSSSSTRSLSTLDASDCQASSAFTEHSLVPQERHEMHLPSIDTTASAASASEAHVRSMALQQRRPGSADLATAVASSRVPHRAQSPPSAASTASSTGALSQTEVDLATQAVVGAAMDVLARDGMCRRSDGRPHVAAAAASPPKGPVVASMLPTPCLHLRAPGRLSSQAPIVSQRTAASVAAIVSAERLNILRMEAELAATRKVEAELLAARRRRALLVSAMVGAR